jgi:endonuclease/exonuclease/phosphatase family metal-dependent hydrolase
MLLILAYLACAFCLAGQQLTVMTYNIHHGEGADGKIDLERIARVITDVAPDLVALQELDIRTQRAGGADQAHELARLTRMHVVFGRTIPYQGGLYGNAILSRWPANGFVNHPLPFTPGREKRGILEAEIECPGLAAFRFLATHFDITAADRRSAAARLGEILRERPSGLPMILAGDLNDIPGSRSLAALGDDWHSTTAGGVLPTSPAAGPKRQIDYILFRPAARWRVVAARVVDEPVASDHRPLVAVLELAPAP